MKIRNLAALSVFPLLLFSHIAWCSTAYLVTLSNGNVLVANSYAVKNGKVYLKYPVGEAAFSARDVVSIKVEGGSADLLQSEGKYVPRKEEPAPQNAVSALSANSLRTGGLSADSQDKGPFGRPKRPTPEERKKAAIESAAQARREREASGQPSVPARNPFGGVDEDPQLSALLDQMTTANEAQQADLEKKLEKMLDGQSVGSQTEIK